MADEAQFIKFRKSYNACSGFVSQHFHLGEFDSNFLQKIVELVFLVVIIYTIDLSFLLKVAVTFLANKTTLVW